MKTPIGQFEEKFGTSMTMLDIKNLINELKLIEKNLIEQAFLDGVIYEAKLNNNPYSVPPIGQSKKYFIDKF